MSKISVNNDYNIFLISESAGSTESLYKDGELHCNCSQEALDAALLAYDHAADLASRNPGYRQLRSDQYKALLSPEGTFETAVGDMLDAIMKAVLLDDKTELLELAEIIQGIKSEIPEA